jgi:hypothetical protein
MTFTNYKKAIEKLLNHIIRNGIVLERKKMDLKNHEPSFFVLILVITWLIMIVTIFIYV